MKIIGMVGGKMDVKRLYLPGVEIKGQCPNCKKEITIDLGGCDYLNFPHMNEPFFYGKYCNDCNHEWNVKLKLTVLLDIVEDKKDAN
jgi:hypothetical protein